MKHAVGLMVAGIVSLNLTVAYGLLIGPPTYALTLTTEAGDVYVLDSGLSRQDCREAMRPGLACEVEAR